MGGRLRDFCLDFTFFFGFYFSTLSTFKAEVANRPVVSRKDKTYYRKQESGMDVFLLEEI
jgi:hypothetical protein